MPRIAPYGAWTSPITGDVVTGDSIVLYEVMVEGTDLYWTELRPAEGGRKVIMRRSVDGRTAEITPKSFNARTRVHEYGGGDFLIADRTVYFSNFADQRLYRGDPGTAPQPFSPPGPPPRPPRGPPLLSIPAPQPRRDAAGLAELEPSQHAVGRYGSLGGSGTRRRIPW